MNEEEEIQILTNELTKKIEFDLISGLECCENAIKGYDNPISFSKFLESLQPKMKNSLCTASWSNRKLVANCSECQYDDNSCICLKCLLKGNHEGHNVYLSYSAGGNCDCGDSTFWKPEGFCSSHSLPEENPEMTQLDRRTRVAMIAASQAFLSHLLFYANYEHVSFELVLKWLQRLIFLGDAPKRCVVRAFWNTLDFYDLYMNCLHLNGGDIEILMSFLSSISNDIYYRNHFIVSFFNSFDKIVWTNGRLLILSRDNKNIPLQQAQKIFDYSYIAEATNVILNNIKEKRINWVEKSIKSLEVLHYQAFCKHRAFYLSHNMHSVAQSRVAYFISAGLNDSDTALNFVEQFSTFLKTNELIYPSTRKTGDKENDPNKIDDICWNIFFNYFNIIYFIAENNIYTTLPLSLLQEIFNDPSKYEKNTNDSLFNHSVLESDAFICQTYPLHLLAYLCLDRKKQSLSKYVSEISHNVHHFLKMWILMPLRWYIAATLQDYDFFVRNNDSLLLSMISFRFRKNIQSKFAVTFALIQEIFFSLDPDESLKMIGHCYGIFSEQFSSLKSENGYLFTLIHFICCLIFDTLCVNKDYFGIRRMIVMTKLKLSTLTTSQINGLWFTTIMNDIKFVEDLLSFSERVSNKSGIYYRLTNDAEWHPLLPFIYPSTILTTIQNFIYKNPSSLIKFPDLSDKRKYILFSPILYALEFYILSQFSSHKELLQLILNLIIITNNSTDFEKVVESQYEESSSIKKDENDILYLIHQFSGIKFSEFLSKKVALNDEEPVSLVDLIKNLDELGHFVLDRLNINDEYHQKVEKRMKGKELKEKLLKDFKEKQSLFSNNNNLTDTTPSTECCSICQCVKEDSFLAYPCIKYKSVLPSLIKNQTNEKTAEKHIEKIVSLKICLHPIHNNCISKTNYFRCPNCRCCRNFLLPIISTEYQPIQSKVLAEGIRTFLDDVYGSDTFIVDIVRSYAAEIELLEIRFRNNPTCLDSLATQEMLHHLYLAMWHTRSSEADYILDNDDDTITPMMRYILFLLTIGSRITEELHLDLVCAISKNLTPHNKLIFLRCCAIFDHFGRGEPIDNSKVIDWDKIFSVDFLKKHYHIQDQHMIDKDLPVFKFVTLPKNFLEFLNYPYSVDITNDDNGITAIDLISGQIITKKKSENDHRKLIFYDFLKRKRLNTFTVFLYLNGPLMSSVVIHYTKFKFLIPIKGFYVDSFGCEDPGLARGRLLTLSESKVDDTIEELLSGNWTNNIKL
ncbi:hypothetical protein TRFO_06571 [Tritrichomonas foetus]|uniref:E3 ubiquitin-protein ligase n=1 Tax=Tritrichomonas foetus TaxID=1144522 RepID=A0A1J4JX61_9EUKA|nr:hypothetical protein TRFO_06571 [Tritrichomonas foetus]|eukprot:OHT03735.1 hypothetical protein TRFO_06571 [Tritrichomonas foetus]